MYKRILSVFLLSVALTASGCSNADISGVKAWGAKHHVKQYSGGVLIGEWDSTGKIENETHSDGYYFEDVKTKKIVRISGDVQITIAD